MLTPPGATNPQLPRISADGLHVVFEADDILAGDEFDPTAPVAWAYDRRITGAGAKDAAGNTRYVQATTAGPSRRSSAGDNRVSPLQNTLSFSPVVSGNGSVVAYEFRIREPFQSATRHPLVLNSPLPESRRQIVVVHRDAAGNIASSDIASEAGSGPPTFGDGDSEDPDISDDGRYV